MLNCKCTSCQGWNSIIRRKKRYTAAQLDLKHSRFRTKREYIDWLRGEKARTCLVRVSNA